MFEIDKKKVRIWSMLGLSRTFGSVLEDLFKEDDKLVLSVADTGRMLAYESFLRNHPEHVMELGIAEQNMVAASAGLANEGYNVFASSYSTFLSSRALDQIRVNMGMMQIPIKLIGSGGGLADGSLSATHMGIEDVANCRCIPGMTVIVPADGVELVKTLFALLKYDHPAYVKLTGENTAPIIYKEDYDFEIGKSVELKKGKDVAIIANGVILKNALEAATILENDNIGCSVIDMHTVSPIDVDRLEELSKTKLIVTIEEHNIHGGLGSAVSEWYADKRDRPYQIMLGFSGDRYPLASEYDNLLRACGLDVGSIVERIKEAYKQCV